jgi:hypothetical protein
MPPTVCEAGGVGCETAFYTTIHEPHDQAAPDREPSEPAGFLQPDARVDSRATASFHVDVVPAAAARLSPALPVGEQLLEHNLYAVL